MKMLYGLILCLFMLSQPVMADKKSNAEQLIKSKLDMVIKILQNTEIEKSEKRKKINDIVSPMFNFKKMAQLSLGKKHWLSLTNEDKKRFTDLFVKRLRNSYLDKLDLYSDENIIYNPAVEIKNKVHVPTELVTKENRVSMLYKLYKSKHCWRVYDIEIQEISIVQTYRSQFNQILNNGTFNDLMASLEQPQSSKSTASDKNEL